MTNPAKPDKPASKPILHQEENPNSQETNTLVALFTEGRYAEAATLAQAITVRFPLYGFGWKVLGAVFKQMGRDADALAPMQKAAALLPSDAQVHSNLGVTLHDMGRLGEAEASYRRALQIKPDNAKAYNNLGDILHDMGRMDGAEASYRQALQTKPDYAEAYNNLGITLKELGRLGEAEASYRRAVQINADYAKAHSNLGDILLDKGRLDEAEASYRRALQIKPDYAKVHSSLGITLKELGRLDESEASYRRALQIKPDYAEAYNNQGITLNELGRLGESEASYRRALQLKPDYVQAHSNLGATLHDMGRLDEAEAICRRALQLKPDYAKAHNNLGCCLLMMGRLSEGWQEYEYRWEGAQPTPQRPITPLPQWTGQHPSSGDLLLVFEEQGLGDKMQFARYLPLAANRFAGGVSLVIGDPLRTLFRRSFPGVEILDAIPADQSAWQWQCPLLSLPLAFGTTLETIPKHVPYLIPDPVQVAIWQARIAELGLPSPMRKIGVVWKTGSLMKNATMRSLTLQQLAPLLNLPGCTWFSLQKEPDPDKTPWVASGKLIDWAEEFGDFDETAALAINLDIIVSADTSVAHLAGGAGRPTWLFNRHASEWRWMRDREDSPWYPMMRIFTQKKVGEWNEVVKRMREALSA